MKKSLLLAACALVCASASAQEGWPSRPVKVIVPSSPGGGTDLYARLLSQALSATAVPYVRSGKLIALAVNEKTPLLPGVPTFAELGWPAVDKVFTSFSVAVPTGTPAPIVHKLSVEIMKAMKSPALADKLAPQGLVPVFDTPEQAARGLKQERDGWADFIRRNGLTASD